MKIIQVIILSIIIVSCNEDENSNTDTELSGKERNLPHKMEYSYECIKGDTGSLSGILGKADDILGKVATFNIEVSDQEQVRFGEQFMAESQQDKNFIIDSANPINIKLNTILADLLRKR
ncbi:MAG TPA: hypothetical protein VK498_12210, partial [Ferruginibacter sp.]|nr:hypothetical protein [Ferruginibacter sp.]